MSEIRFSQALHLWGVDEEGNCDSSDNDDMKCRCFLFRDVTGENACLSEKKFLEHVRKITKQLKRNGNAASAPPVADVVENLD